jgi:hypothetical protein
MHAKRTAGGLSSTKYAVVSLSNAGLFSIADPDVY